MSCMHCVYAICNYDIRKYVNVNIKAFILRGEGTHDYKKIYT